MNRDKGSLICSIRGPLVMITIGVLFALDQQAGLPFWKSWPVILILIGIMKLLERMLRDRSEEPPAQGTFAGGVS